MTVFAEHEAVRDHAVYICGFIGVVFLYSFSEEVFEMRKVYA